MLSSIAGRSATQVEALPSPAARMNNAAMACHGARAGRPAADGAAIAAMRWRKAGGAAGLTSSRRMTSRKVVRRPYAEAREAFRQKAFKIEHAGSIEFAVERRLGEKSFVACAHFASGLPKAAMRRPRARARRDITVPTGAPVISAISR